MDLGSGTLVDLARYGLPHEPTPREAIAARRRPRHLQRRQAARRAAGGLIVGRKELIARIRKNPLKRALRVDKMTLAALEAVLRALRRSRPRCATRLPTLRLLDAPQATTSRRRRSACSPRCAPPLGAGRSRSSVADCASQIGSGALPVDALPSAGLRARAVEPARRRRGERSRRRFARCRCR